MRWCSLLAALFACGCVTLTPQGERVSVYRAPLNAIPSKRSMPEGCRLLRTKPPVSMPELDLEGQKDPFRRERNAEGAEGEESPWGQSLCDPSGREKNVRVKILFFSLKFFNFSA